MLGSRDAIACLGDFELGPAKSDRAAAERRIKGDRIGPGCGVGMGNGLAQ